MNKENKLVLELQNEMLELKNYDIFNRSIEIRVTGFFKSVNDTMYTYIAIFNIISNPEKVDNAFSILEMKVENMTIKEKKLVPLFSEDIKSKVLKVLWTDCKFFEFKEFYCVVTYIEKPDPA